MEVAGFLDQVGDGADTTLQVGDRVMAIVVPRGSAGAYAEQVVVPAESVAAMPAGSSFAEAATLPMNGLTAQLTLDLLGLEPGQTLAVTGAAGAYGGYMVQLAKAAGLRVIADASEKDQALVRDLGADVVVPRGDDVAARIREVVPDGVDAIADGSVQQALLFPAVRDGGGFASVRAYDPGEPPRGIRHHAVWVREYARAQDKLDALRRLVDEGKVTLRVARTFRAEDAGEAHRLLEAGGTRGRFVIEL
jgi:NADPH:quinone reductase-like Zn-dependent oxidoreductase